MKTIAWAYMIELEDGLSKKQMEALMKLAPEGTELFPFSLEGAETPAEANSMAIGFIDNEYYEELSNVQSVLAEVCNDWENEREEHTYLLAEEDDEEEALQVIMLCDFETIK